MSRNFVKLKEIVNAAADRPGMYLPTGDSYAEYQAFAAGLFLGVDDDLFEDFKAFVYGKHGGSAIGPIAYVGWLQKINDPNISDDAQIKALSEELVAFFEAKATPTTRGKT